MSSAMTPVLVNRLPAVPGGAERLEPSKGVVEIGSVVHPQHLRRPYRFGQTRIERYRDREASWELNLPRWQNTTCFLFKNNRVTDAQNQTFSRHGVEVRFAVTRAISRSLRRFARYRNSFRMTANAVMRLQRRDGGPSAAIRPQHSLWTIVPIWCSSAHAGRDHRGAHHTPCCSPLGAIPGRRPRG